MLLTYLNNPQLKADFLAQIAEHEAADAFLKATYGHTNGQFRGCAIGCSLHSLNVLQGKADPTECTSNHERYPEELGLPIWLAHVEDTIFEMLPIAQAKTWPRRLSEAVPVGAVVDDLVWAKILRWSLADPQFGVRQATADAKVRGYIDVVIAGFDAEIAGTATDAMRAKVGDAAWAARAGWDAYEAWAAWRAWYTMDARAAMDAWYTMDARAARAWEARAGFYLALSEFVIATVRDLEPIA